jgi:hypothetical protein
MILSFSTHKGGTGKTTSSINLAAGLAREGQKTLLVDMDPQGHSTLGLGVELTYDEPNIASVSHLLHMTFVLGLGGSLCHPCFVTPAMESPPCLLSQRALLPAGRQFCAGPIGEAIWP